MFKSVIAALILVGVAVGDVRSEERLRDFHVLGIGVNQYADEKVLDLRQAVADVFQLTEYLSEQDFDRRSSLRKPRLVFDESATKERIERELEDLPNWVADEATVAVVLSGHGTSTDDQWLFSPHDTRLERFADSQVTGSTIMRKIDSLISRRRCRVLLILEACHSGKILEVAKPILEKCRRPEQGGLILLASCLPNQGGLETKGGDVFNATLMMGLKFMHAHSQDTGSVSVAEIRAYMQRELMNRIRFSVTHSPGFEWPEQSCLVECSPSIPQSLGLTWADTKFNAPVSMDALRNPGPPARMTGVVTDLSPTGKWICVRPYVLRYCKDSMEPEVVAADREGKVITSALVLDLRADGTYRVYHRNFAGEESSNSGKYRFESGRGLSLTYGNGTDYFSVTELNRQRLVLEDPTAFPTPLLLREFGVAKGDLDPVWEFRKVED